MVDQAEEDPAPFPDDTNPLLVAAFPDDTNPLFVVNYATTTSPGNFHGHRGQAGDDNIAEETTMAQDPVDIEADKISGLPDDVLLDILGRLAKAGDVHTVARTSILSRRWRSLPWPQIPTVSLDIGDFFVSEWQVWRSRRSRRRQHKHNFGEQHEATARFTDALARFMAAPPSARVIETLSLKLILTRRHDYMRRVGELVGAAADAGAANKTIELELVTEVVMPSVPLELYVADARTKLGYGERFWHLVHDCPGAFRSLTKLALQHLWFDDPAEVNKLVCGCHALQHLSLSSCGLLTKTSRQAMDDGELLSGFPMLIIDAPQSRLQTLVCEFCFMGGVELVQAPELVTLDYNAGGLLLQDYHPVSLGCAPSLQRLSVCQFQHDDRIFKIKLSELLVNIKLESLQLAFLNGKIWVQPERPSKQLRAALGGLKSLLLKGIYAECNYLSWTTFLLEAAPLLETLEIHICSHVCVSRKKRRKNTNLVWEPSPGFRHHHLKQLSFHRAFHVRKDLPLARRLMELAPNLQGVTLGVRSLKCPECLAIQRKKGVAATRLRFAEGSRHVDAFVRKLKDGIPTSAQITLILSEIV